MELETTTDGDNSVVESAESINVLNLNDFKSSHLNDNAPPFCDKSELMPVGDGFGFVHFVKW
jgi:hypothetical protein